MAATRKSAASSATKAAKKTTKAPAKKPAAKPPVKKVTAKKAAPAKKAAVKKAPAKKAAIKKAPAKKAPVKKVTASAKPKRKPVVREDESPWTAAELRSVRQELDAEVIRLEEEIATAEAGLQDLIRDSGDGAGDDQADAGSKTFEREHEMSLANNARDMLLQAHHALARIDDGTYGICESCGKPIGKYRLQAFPRATLCLVCKQQEERT
jgi:RNA polymerase-binding protein DksA